MRREQKTMVPMLLCALAWLLASGGAAVAQVGDEPAACAGPALVSGETVMQVCVAGQGLVVAAVSLREAAPAELFALVGSEGLRPGDLRGAAVRGDGAVGLLFESGGALRGFAAEPGGGFVELGRASEHERPLGVAWRGETLEVVVRAEDFDRPGLLRRHRFGPDGIVRSDEVDLVWCELGYGDVVAWPAGEGWDLAFAGRRSLERCVGATQRVESTPLPAVPSIWGPWLGGALSAQPMGNVVPSRDGPRVIGGGGGQPGVATAVFLDEGPNRATVLFIDEAGGTRLELPDGRLVGATGSAEDPLLRWVGAAEVVAPAPVPPDLALIPRPGGFAVFRGGRVLAWLDDDLSEVDTP